MTKVEEASAEVEAALKSINPEVEGLQDFKRLNLKPETMKEIDFSIAQFTQRKSLLEKALVALKALSDDGYPEVQTREIADAAFKDLAENASTIEAALAKFESNKATDLNTTAGKPVPKEFETTQRFDK